VDDYVAVTLNRDLALVLLDWRGRTSTAGQPVEFTDQAEQRALWDLESALESVLPEALQDDYRERIVQARGQLRDDDP